MLDAFPSISACYFWTALFAPRKHANLVELNKKVMEALQMYHSLMKETPTYGYPAMKASGPSSMYNTGSSITQGLPQAGPNTGIGQPAQVGTSERGVGGGLEADQTPCPVSTRVMIPSLFCDQ